MVTQRRRRILPDDGKVLEAGTLQELEREGLRVIRSIGAEREFRHDQMRAFLAALWLVEETPNLPALQKTVSDVGAFALNRRDQEELWTFVALLLTSAAAFKNYGFLLIKIQLNVVIWKMLCRLRLTNAGSLLFGKHNNLSPKQQRRKYNRV